MNLNDREDEAPVVDKDDLQMLVEGLMRDNKKRDEVIGRASAIIETINLENKSLRARLKDKTEQIEDLRRNERALEARLLSLQSEVHNVAKLRAIETKLRSELEGIKHELSLVEADKAKTEEELKERLKSVELQLDTEIRMKENILKEITDLTNSEKASNNLVEDYISQLRSVENENTDLKEEYSKLQDRIKQLEDRHSAEIATMSAANKQMIEAFKNRRDQTEGYFTEVGAKTPKKKGKPVSQQLMIDSLNSVLENLYNLDSFIGRLAEDELDEFNLLKAKMEESSKLLANIKMDSYEMKKIESLLDANEQLSELVLQQNDLIAELTAHSENAGSFLVEVSESTAHSLAQIADCWEETTEAARRSGKLAMQAGEDAVRSLQGELRRIAELVARHEDRAGLAQGAQIKPALDAVRDLLAAMVSQNADSKRSGERVLQLEAVKNEMVLKMEELVKELEAKNVEIIELLEDLNALEEENKRLIKAAAESDETLEDSLRKANLKIDQLKNENTRLIKKCEDIALKDVHREKNHTLELRSQAREEKDLQYKVKSLQTEVTNLQFKLKEKEDELENYHSQLEKRKLKLDQVTFELGVAKTKEQTLLSEVHSLKKELGELKGQLHSGQGSKSYYGYDTFSHHNYGRPSQEQPRNTLGYRYDYPRGRYESASKGLPIGPRNGEEDLDEFERNLMSNAEFD
jgi:chromosome segregation ATPase